MEKIFDAQGSPVATVLEGAELQTLVGPPPDQSAIDSEVERVLAEPPAAGRTPSTWLD